MQPQRDVALAPRTTFRLGGKARYFVEVKSDDEVRSALIWADDANISEVLILGGGSNLVVADTGTPGLVIQTGQKGLNIDDRGATARIRANAGECFDDLVRYAVDRELVGLECLSGIPGSVGATPIQNVGAYGQDIAQTLASVTVFDRIGRNQLTFSQQECQFGYRDSRFKSLEPDRYVVLCVEFQLRRGDPAPLRNRELASKIEIEGILRPSVRQIRQAVIELRAAKSMLADAENPLARSAGSFFVNPIVPRQEAHRISTLSPNHNMPSWDMPDGNVKLAAAWLIEHSGTPRGHRLGPVGLSPYHCLVIVAHARCEAADVIAYAHQIRSNVRDKFGVELVPEPRFWGFGRIESGLPVLDSDEGPRTLDSASWQV